MIGRILSAGCAAVGAGSFAQFPEFYQQYLQRLGGRLDQARLDLKRLMEDAAILGRSVEAYIQELFASGTEAAEFAARREQERLDGARELEQAYQALSQAGPMERPVAFLRHVDPEIAEATWAQFAPAVPVTLEGFAYAAAGLLLGLLVAATGSLGRRRAMGWIKQRQERADGGQQV